ncbi:hypothetical protein OL229_07060 [Neisseriaceae bacterium JH1-16]|nr:hypothetical protein [Neisseriaceae bacterium JH1-16]
MRRKAIYDEFRLALLNMISAAEALAKPGFDAKSLINELNQAKENFESLSQIQKKLIGACPDELLSYLWIDLSNHYQRILPKEAGKNLPKIDDIATQQTIKCRAACLAVSTWLFRYYRFIDQRESLISDTKKYLCSIFTTVVLLTIIIPGIQSAIYLAFGMLVAGMLGAGFSISRRIQQVVITPVDDLDRETVLVQLDKGKWGTYLSLISGCIFPFVLYMIFASNLITDGSALFSAASSSQGDPSHPAGIPTSTLTIANLYQSIQWGNATVAKVLVWSFISGFAERFVPDVLDRIISKASK